LPGEQRIFGLSGSGNPVVTDEINEKSANPGDDGPDGLWTGGAADLARPVGPLLPAMSVSAEAFFWTAVSLPVAGPTGAWPRRLIRLGATAILAGLASCAPVFDRGPLALIVLAGGLTGIGFGLSYAFITQEILGALHDEERAIGGAGIATARLTGAAAGSAMAAAVANLAGFAHGFTPAAAPAAGIWVFVAALPVAALACLSARQIEKSRAARAVELA
jgi:hypothetical protein